MNQLKRLLYPWLPLLILVYLVVSPIQLWSQIITKVINLDIARYYWIEPLNEMRVPRYSGNEHSGIFPNGTYYMGTISNNKENMLFGHIVLPNGDEQRGYMERVEGGGYYHGAPFGIWEVCKYPPPKVTVDGVQSSSEFKGFVDPEIKADKMFVVYRKHQPFMHIRYEGYQFVNQYYGDFVILKITYKLTFDDDHTPEISPDSDADATQTVEDFYLFKSYRLSQTAYTGRTGMDPDGGYFVHHGAMWTSTMKVPSIVSGCDRDELILTYGWTGDHPDIPQFITGGRYFDTTGFPRFKPVPDGVLTSTPYNGFALLHCDRSPTDKTDWVKDQPYTSRVRVNFSHNRGSAQWPGSKTTYDYFIPPGSGIYEISTLEDGTDSNPTTIAGKQPVQIWGGWDMVLNDSVTTVHTVGSGSITREECRAVGRAWAKWYESGDVPEAYYDDVELGHVLVTDQIKNQIIARGKDSLIVAMQRAQDLWENDLICPHPYPSPDLYITSGPYSVTLEWDDILNKYPNHEAGSVLAYRIYRKKGDVLDEHADEAGKNLYWEMIKEIPPDELEKSAQGFFTYTDVGLSVGEDYHYAVTVLSENRCGIDGTGPRLESSKWSNRSDLAARPFVPGKSHLDSLVVVPNPYYINAALMNFSSDNNRLMFANLPPYCTLLIYNVTGDLIHTIYHQSGTSNDFWDQITQSNQYIASGVYILIVKDAKKLIKDNEGNLSLQNIPEKRIIKFTIIR